MAKELLAGSHVSALYLTQLGMCPREVKKFKRIFPRGAKLNRASILKAAKGGLNVRYFAREQAEYQPNRVEALERYNEANTNFIRTQIREFGQQLKRQLEAAVAIKTLSLSD